MRVKITPSTGNVFRDVGFSPKESAHLKLRADLLIDLQQALAKRGLTQASAAKILGVHPPRVSDLMRGRIELFNIETLIDMLARLGIGVKIVTARPRRRAGAA